MDESYRTVDGPGESAFESRGSEFLGHVRPARSVGEAETFVDAIDDEYPDATHVVPAYRVRVGGEAPDGGAHGNETPGSGMLREYSSDDGEPAGSAGKPALNVLVRRDLENVVAAVVRYYGGTNLGVGGLARAYSGAVTDAVDDAGVVEREPHDVVVVTVGYDDSGTVRGIVESTDATFEAAYEERVTFEVLVPRTGTDDLRDRIRSATSGRAAIE